MSGSFEFKGKGVAEALAALPKAATDLAELAQWVTELLRSQAESGSSEIGRDCEADSHASFLRDDTPITMVAALESLGKSARMMQEIVDDTRRDRAEFEIRGRHIDRTLARIDRTLENVIGPS
jgi:hypothetical protein